MCTGIDIWTCLYACLDRCLRVWKMGDIYFRCVYVNWSVCAHGNGQMWMGVVDIYIICVSVWIDESIFTAFVYANGHSSFNNVHTVCLWMDTRRISGFTSVDWKMLTLCVYSCECSPMPSFSSYWTGPYGPREHNLICAVIHLPGNNMESPWPPFPNDRSICGSFIAAAGERSYQLLADSEAWETEDPDLIMSSLAGLHLADSVASVAWSKRWAVAKWSAARATHKHLWEPSLQMHMEERKDDAIIDHHYLF